MAPSSREIETHSPELSLVRLPIRDDPIAQAVIGLLLVVVGALAWSGSISLWIGMVAVALGLIATWKLFIPVKIDLGPRGIVQSSILGTHKTAWREIVRWQTHSQGVVLYLTPDNSPLAGFASIDLSQRGQADELESVVRYYMESRRLRTGSSIVRLSDSSPPQS